MTNSSFSISYCAYPFTTGSLDEIIPEVKLLDENDNNAYIVKCFDDETDALVCSGEIEKKELNKQFIELACSA